MKYNGELNGLLLNIQRNMKDRYSGIAERQVNNATVDKSIIRERQKLREKTAINNVSN